MTYSAFEAEIGDWLARGDLVSTIPSFIKLAEAKLNRRLRLRAMETENTFTITDEVATMPADFLKVITVLNGTCRLNYVTRWTESNSLSGTQYSTEGFNLVVGPNIAEIDVKYYAKITALDSADPDSTNWLLENAYDVYLYAVLVEATPYLQDDARINIWSTLFESAIKELQDKDKSDKLGEGPLIPTRAVGWTP